MSKSPHYRKIIDLYPEEAREAADILKRAVPLMMRHALPPNPVHFALWYTYCKGRDEELKRRLDKAVVDYGGLPPELAEKMFREFIINGELDEARAGQQQVIELVDAIEGGISSSVSGSAAFQETLSKGLAALQEPVVDELPNVLSDLQQSTQIMQDQQEKFLYRQPAPPAGTCPSCSHPRPSNADFQPQLIHPLTGAVTQGPVPRRCTGNAGH